MGCCEDIPIDGEYIPIHRRFLEYGKDSYGDTLAEKFPITHMWIFTFYEDAELCTECQDKLSEMHSWFEKYNLFNDPIKNVKWVVDDDIANNLILIDLHVNKTPVHFFCDSDGKIVDIVYGFPDTVWLEKHILPLITKEAV